MWRADFFQQFIQTALQSLVPDLRQRSPRTGLKTIGQVQQLGVKVIDSKVLVVIGPLRGVRIERVVEITSHAS